MLANKWRTLMLGAALITVTQTSGAATQAQIDTARNKGLWWLFTHQNGEGRWGNTPAASIASTATALEAQTSGSASHYFCEPAGAIVIAPNGTSAQDGCGRNPSVTRWVSLRSTHPTNI